MQINEMIAFMDGEISRLDVTIDFLQERRRELATKRGELIEQLSVESGEEN